MCLKRGYTFGDVIHEFRTFVLSACKARGSTSNCSSFEKFNTVEVVADAGNLVNFLFYSLMVVFIAARAV